MPPDVDVTSSRLNNCTLDTDWNFEPRLIVTVIGVDNFVLAPWTSALLFAFVSSTSSLGRGLKNEQKSLCASQARAATQREEDFHSGARRCTPPHVPFVARRFRRRKNGENR